MSNLTALEELIDKFISMHLTENSRNGLGKLLEEVNEFIDDSTVEEGADVLICVMIELRKRGVSLEDLLFSVYEKMRLNLSRTWEVQSDGTLHHVKDVNGAT